MITVPSFGADAMTTNTRDALVRGVDERGLFLGASLSGGAGAVVRVPRVAGRVDAPPEALG
jgi:hypothetical protein